MDITPTELARRIARLERANGDDNEWSIRLKNGTPLPAGIEQDGVELSPAMDSAIKDVEAAGDEIFVYKYQNWYRKLNTEVSNRTGELLTKRTTVDEFIDAIQKVADEVKADPDIPKYRR